MNITHALSQSSSKSHGADGISVAMLTMATSIIIPYLAKLINKSSNESIFPTSWKDYLTNPLFKTLVPLLPSETRPIALLSEVSKILEKHAFSQLSTFVVEINLLGPFQSCYKKGQEMHTAFLGVLEKNRRAIEDRKMTMIVLFDFTKAFDCIPHEFHVRKL